MVVAGRRGQEWGVTVSRVGVSVWADGQVLDMEGGNGGTVYPVPPNHTRHLLKWYVSYCRH